MNPSDSSSEMESNPTSAYHAMILEETDLLFSSEWNQLKSSASVVNRSTNRMDVKVFKAAREGNIDALRECSDPLHQMLTPTKSTVLHVYIACVGGAMLKESEEWVKSAEVVRGMLKMCQRLLLQPNEKGDTALHLAARHGRADIVGDLIQAAKDWHGDLEEGISSKDVCYQFLIRRTNKEKNTALHEAVRFKHLDVVKILTGKDPEFLYPANDAGETPLYMAAERRYTDLVFEILDSCKNPSYQGPNGLTALHIAAQNGDEKISERILKKEKTLALAIDGEGLNPLHVASFWGHVSVVKQILEADTSTAYIGNIEKLAPVHFAAMKGRVDVMELLLLCCPDSFELVDGYGWNALHYAIFRNKPNVEEFVRKDPWLSSVLLNSKDSSGNTPLHQIAKSEYEYNGLKFIRDFRVDKMVFNNENMNPLNIIQRNVKAASEWKRKLTQGLIDSGASAVRGMHRKKDGDSEVDGKRGDKESSEEDSRYKDIKESHMVVSALIATVTFAAGFTMPGGYQSEKGPDQGSAVLSRNAAFMAFVISNTFAMSMSSCAVMIRFFMLLRGRELISKCCPSGPYRVALDLTLFALIAMVVAFVTGTYAVLSSHSSLPLAIAASVLGCFFFFGLGAFVFVPAFATLRRCLASIYQLIHVFLYHLLHGNFKKLVKVIFQLARCKF